MSPVTEVAFLPLRPGVDINDVSCHEGKVMADMLEAGKVAPGCTKNYWGLEHDISEHVHLMLDWESLEAHRTYQAQPGYPEFLAAARSMINPAQNSEAFHIAFSPHPPTAALHSPVAVVLRAYFPVDQQSSAGEEFAEDFGKVMAALGDQKFPGYTGNLSSGWSLEEVDREGGPCRVFMAVAGWESVAAHTQAAESDLVKSIPVRNKPKDMSTVHVHFKSP